MPLSHPPGNTNVPLAAGSEERPAAATSSSEASNSSMSAPNVSARRRKFSISVANAITGRRFRSSYPSLPWRKSCGIPSTTSLMSRPRRISQLF